MLPKIRIDGYLSGEDYSRLKIVAQNKYDGNISMAMRQLIRKGLENEETEIAGQDAPSEVGR